MLPLEQIQTEIESLSAEEVSHLRRWLEERDWQDWDRQIEADSAAGKLDFLKEEAARAKQANQLREL